MEVIEIAHNIFRFKPVPCTKCDYRFICWTCQATMCALKAYEINVCYHFGNIKYYSVMRTPETRHQLVGDVVLIRAVGSGLLDVKNKQKS